MLLNEELYKKYGAIEYNTLPGANYHDIERETVSWYDLKKSDRLIAERIRILTDPGFPWFDISYFHLWINGKPSEIRDFPVDQLPRRTYKKILIEECKKQGIFIVDVVSDGVISRMY